MAPRSIRRAAVAGLAAVALFGSAACGSGFDDDSTGDAAQSSGPANLQILIGSSGEAETKAVQDAAAKWAGSSGNTATVTPAQDLTQQLSQALAGSTAGRLHVDAPIRRLRQRGRPGAVRDKISNSGDFTKPVPPSPHGVYCAEGLHPRTADRTTSDEGGLTTPTPTT
jgi:multiple sugar transport system substrate-binding protein